MTRLSAAQDGRSLVDHVPSPKCHKRKRRARPPGYHRIIVNESLSRSQEALVESWDAGADLASDRSAVEGIAGHGGVVSTATRADSTLEGRTEVDADHFGPFEFIIPPPRPGAEPARGDGRHDTYILGENQIIRVRYVSPGSTDRREPLPTHDGNDATAYHGQKSYSSSTKAIAGDTEDDGSTTPRAYRNEAEEPGYETNPEAARASPRPRTERLGERSASLKSGKDSNSGERSSDVFGNVSTEPAARSVHAARYEHHPINLSNGPSNAGNSDDECDTPQPAPRKRAKAALPHTPAQEVASTRTSPALSRATAESWDSVDSPRKVHHEHNNGADWECCDSPHYVLDFVPQTTDQRHFTWRDDFAELASTTEEHVAVCKAEGEERIGARCRDEGDYHEGGEDVGDGE